MALVGKLKTSYWFVPSLMAIGATLLSFGMLTLDRRVAEETRHGLRWIYTGGPEGARQVLSTIAGSIITVAGTVFSITIAALTLASAQFGPRLMRNFMSDRGNQFVLGTFTSTFIYCLLILRTVRGSDYTLFVPEISVTVAVVLAIVSVGVLIYYIHHAAQSIQVSHLIRLVGKDLDETIKRIFPENAGPVDPSEGGAERPLPSGDPHIIHAEDSGYLQAIASDTIFEAAVKHRLTVKLLARPGDYIIVNEAVVEVWPGCDDHVAKVLGGSFAFGEQRTATQDAEHAVLQLVEIGIRAVSPGVNDPFTATMCVDRVSAGLHLLIPRHLPSRYRLDKEGDVRVIAPVYTYEDMVRAAYGLYAPNGAPQDPVLDRIRSHIDRLLAAAPQPEFRAALREARSELPAGPEVRP